MSDVETATFHKLAGFLSGKTGLALATAEELLHYLPHIGLVLHFLRTSIAQFLWSFNVLPEPFKADVSALTEVVVGQYPLNAVRHYAGYPSIERCSLALAVAGILGVYALCTSRKTSMYAAAWYALLLLETLYALSSGEVSIGKGRFSPSTARMVTFGAQCYLTLMFGAALYVITHKDYAFCFYVTHLKHLLDEHRGLIPKKVSSPRKSASPKKEPEASPKKSTRDASPAPKASAKKSGKK